MLQTCCADTLPPARVRPAALAAVLLLAACGPTITETVLPPDNVYVCRDGSTMRVVRGADGRAAQVSAGNRNVVLQRVDSAAQEKYSNGPTTLYLEGEKALLTSDSFVVAGPCVSSAPLPVQPAYRY